MIVRIDKTGSREGLETILQDVASLSDVRTMLIFAADDNGFRPENIDEVLQKPELPLFGGIFPQILYGREKLSTGTIVIGITHPIILHHIEDISSPETDFDGIIDDSIPDIGNARTMFVIFDAFSKRVGSLVESLFNIFGLELNYIGGGAGSINPIRLGRDRPPAILTNDGLKKDCAILATMDTESGIGVKHGWDIAVSDPFRVTETEGNIIQTLDWRPAFEVYQDVLHKHSGTTITRENFFDIAKSYPFGITKLEAEQIVRDPFDITEEGGLVFITEIPRESFVTILTGDLRSLIGAAAMAYREGVEAFPGRESKCVLIVDCISRVLFLGEHFNSEIAAMAPDEPRVVGALTIGEIANNGKDYLELYNKTCVVGIMGL